MRWRFLSTVLISVVAVALGFLFGRQGRKIPPLSQSQTTDLTVVSPSAGTNAQYAREFRWSQLESADYTSYIASLRRVGCPEQTIRDIIVADICNLYSQEWKRKYLASKPDYWNPEYGMGPIQSEAIQKMAAQVQALLRQNVFQLLGVDLEKELEKYRAIGGTQLGEEFLLSAILPPEKVTAVSKALKKYRIVRQSVESAGFLTAEGVLTLKRSREDFHRELGTFLSPEEITQVNYRCSETAQEIRDKMVGFDLTEKEFQGLYARRILGQEQFEAAVEKGNASQPLTSDQVLKLAADNELSEEARKEILSPERYAENQRSQDARYQHIKEAAAQSNLSLEWVKTFYDNQRASEEQARSILENPNLTAEQKETMIQEARNLSQEQLRQWLGDELARKFQPVLIGP